ncbi:hypothetical protein ARMGADRAFT_591499 [Armillaria gallica]|uniref:Uncharacterized protein n=1 Tax=Armillaria gallica TaxID=47427 RepID=A0A2H3D7P5_ARMGA|nr:hypothetical protein ARMGADRAFT_591499 [Armillaria gallica]
MPERNVERKTFRNRMERAIRDSDHRVPSVSHRHRGLYQQHPRLRSPSKNLLLVVHWFTVCDPLFTRLLSFLPKSTISFLIHAPWKTSPLLTVPAVGLLHTNASLRCTFMASGVLR